MDVEQLSQYKAPQEPAPAPITPPPSHPASPAGRRWGMLAGFFVLALAVSAGAYFFLSEKYAAEPVIPTYTPRADSMAGWKTYTNTEYGYEMKYPVAYEVRTQIGNPTIFFPETELITGEFNTSLEPQRVSITVSKQTNLSLQEWVRQKWPVADGRTQITQNINALISGGVNTTIDGHAALQIDLGEEQYTFIDNGNRQVVRIFCWAQPLCSQILSTFKFTTPLNTSTWKTYTNTKYGIEIKYPKNYDLRTTSIIGTGTAGSGGQWVSTYFGWTNAQNEIILAAISIPDTDPTSDFDAGFLALSVTDESQSLCGNVRGGTAEGTVVFAGTTFKKTGNGGAGLGHQSVEHNYAGWHNNQCIVISTVLQTSGYQASDTITHQVDPSTIFSALDQILSTFKFTR